MGFKQHISRTWQMIEQQVNDVPFRPDDETAGQRQEKCKTGKCRKQRRDCQRANPGRNWRSRTNPSTFPRSKSNPYSRISWILRRFQSPISERSRCSPARPVPEVQEAVKIHAGRRHGPAQDDIERHPRLL